MSTGSLKEGDSIAAVDLGSNSFHLVVARVEDGQPRIIDRLREPVRMAFGLRPDGTLEPERQRRALACLAKFGQRLVDVPSERVRAVATNAVRALKAPRAFLLIAETALGHPIEVVSGREEARLIYLGVANGLPPSRARRLVVDIGGGSTEFIIGEGLKTLETESLQVGCVGSTMRFFPDGKITRKRWAAAQTEVEVELQQFAAIYRTRGFREAIGSSGTMRALGAICHGLGGPDQIITAEGLEQIRERLIDAGDPEKIELPDLSEDRRPIISGGAAIAEAVFRTLGLERMHVTENAMRDGLLLDLLGRAEHRDPREASVDMLARRYGVDLAQAQRVLETVEAMYADAAIVWELGESAHDWLRWATKLHEIGLAVAHSQYHVHGAYLVGNTDLPGFSRQEQQVLAFLVRAHRRNPPLDELATLPERLARPAARLTVLLRLAVLLNRARTSTALPPIGLQAGEKTLKLKFPAGWLEAHPLTRADLDQERKQLAGLGLKLSAGS